MNDAHSYALEMLLFKKIAKNVPLMGDHLSQKGFALFGGQPESDTKGFSS